MDNIFITRDQLDSDPDFTNMNGKMTYTELYDSIPSHAVDEPTPNWKDEYMVEWRWRFLKFDRETTSVEISYMIRNSDDRVYFNRYGKWVKRDVPPIPPKYVLTTKYLYNDE